MGRGTQLKRKHSTGTITAEVKKARLESAAGPARSAGEAHLCTYCRDIDFDEIFRTEVKACGKSLLCGKLVQQLGHISSSTSSVPGSSLSETTICDLCQFFRSLAVAPNSTHLELHAYSAQAAFRTPRGIVPDSVMLAVIPSKRARRNRQPMHPVLLGKMIMQCHDSSNQITGRKTASAIDFGLVRSWLEFCDAHHEHLCRRDDVSSIPGFRVIDCAARKVVPWSAIQNPGSFVALSYVWGNSIRKYDCTTEDGCLPDDVPRVVADAMEVTRELGFKYIWIDRYCIPQDNSKDKHTQIQNMNLVYGSSVVTIVAAAGKNSSRGLPGVGSSPRSKQLSVRIGTRTLVATNHNVREQVLRSRWNERAWTYQEALLSKRRLVFTPSLVYFQCGAMHCVETLTVPLGLLHTNNRRRMRDSVDMSRVWPLRGNGKHPTDLEERIVEYVKRKLTYSADALQAFDGILSKFEAMEYPVPSICGIPLFGTEDDNITSSLIIGLSWQIHMLNSSSKLKRHQWRRPGFPSWSWAGWDLAGVSSATASFTWDFEQPTWPRYDESKFKNKTTLKPVTAMADIHIRLNDGTVLPWHDASNRIMAMVRSGNAPEELLITGFTADVRLKEEYKYEGATQIYYKTGDGNYFGQTRGLPKAFEHARTISRCAKALGVDVRPADDSDVLFHHLRFILLGYMPDTTYPRRLVMVMVLHRPENSDRYERLTLVVDSCYSKNDELNDMCIGVAPKGWTRRKTRIA